jgi:hypothetical protein
MMNTTVILMAAETLGFLRQKDVLNVTLKVQGASFVMTVPLHSSLPRGDFGRPSP